MHQQLLRRDPALRRRHRADVARRRAVALGDPHPFRVAEELRRQRRRVRPLADRLPLDLDHRLGIVLRSVAHPDPGRDLRQRLIPHVAATHHRHLRRRHKPRADQHRLHVVPMRKVGVIDHHQLRVRVLRSQLAHLVEQVGQMQPDVVDRVELVEHAQMPTVRHADHVAVVALRREHPRQPHQLVEVGLGLVPVGELLRGQRLMQLAHKAGRDILCMPRVVGCDHQSSIRSCVFTGRPTDWRPADLQMRTKPARSCRPRPTDRRVRPRRSQDRPQAARPSPPS